MGRSTIPPSGVPPSSPPPPLPEPTLPPPSPSSLSENPSPERLGHLGLEHTRNTMEPCWGPSSQLLVKSEAHLENAGQIVQPGPAPRVLLSETLSGSHCATTTGVGRNSVRTLPPAKLRPSRPNGSSNFRICGRDKRTRLRPSGQSGLATQVAQDGGERRGPVCGQRTR